MYEIKKGQTKVCPFFFRTEFKVFFSIILVSSILLISTFSFDTVPPILNRGIQPATFPKGLLVLMIVLTSIIYYLSFKKPWKKEKNLPKPFFLTILSFIIFIVISKTLDFFLAISVLSIFVSYNWGERRIFYLLLVGIIFPLVVFIFFEMILGLRFPPGIITNLYYY
ncbi:tripartite tricarboxylate transporter TctB family protein [Candidatus Pelagibacter sp.]|nr:tripartite tricarboxylate transporter TctB family protein [Candidatus Pelagibacter sp.]